tara:strand:+ start:288 stop:575 length:288 start_codon:yes stop_codon:yes gene_type:complete
VKQDEDYELIPGENNHWNIRIKTGYYVETVFNFGELKVGEDGETLTFTSDVVYDVLGEWWKPHEDIDWHHTTGEILYDILEQQIERQEKDIVTPE